MWFASHNLHFRDQKSQKGTGINWLTTNTADQVYNPVLPRARASIEGRAFHATTYVAVDGIIDIIVEGGASSISYQVAKKTRRQRT